MFVDFHCKHQKFDPLNPELMRLDPSKWHLWDIPIGRNHKDSNQDYTEANSFHNRSEGDSTIKLHAPKSVHRERTWMATLKALVKFTIETCIGKFIYYFQTFNWFWFDHLFDQIFREMCISVFNECCNTDFFFFDRITHLDKSFISLFVSLSFSLFS